LPNFLERFDANKEQLYLDNKMLFAVFWINHVFHLKILCAFEEPFMHIFPIESREKYLGLCTL
jgi:hypothetical protein